MLNRWLRRASPRRGLFLGIMLMLAAVLGLLGWRLLKQDEQLAVQRLADAREVAADLLVGSLEQRLTAIRRALDGVSRSDLRAAFGEEPGAVRVRLRADRVDSWPAGRLPYHPVVPPASDVSTALFATADDLEFRQGDPSRAAASLAPLARSPDPNVSAAALVRIARNHLKAGSHAAALEAYASLGALGGVSVGGMPAALAARIGIIVVHERQGDRAAVARNARALADALRSPVWPISAATFAYLDGQMRRLLPAHDVPAPADLVLAEAVAWLWEQRGTLSREGGRTGVVLPSGPALIVWQDVSGETAAFVAGREYVERAWRADVQPILDARGLAAAITTPDGAAVLGSVAPRSRSSVRHATVTGLPWTVQVTTTDEDTAALRDRRRMLIAGLGVLIALILAGAWFMERTLARELALADLQSEFVSAVSHEFRTPLTTLCQLSELLHRGRVATDGDRREYYRLLNGESQRLKRLVETLLTFGRLEAGRMPLRRETIDLAALARQTADEFAASDQALGHRLNVDASPAGAWIRADPEMVRAVLWNLFENAAKYSPECETIWVTLRQEGAQAAVAVRDEGVGIPRPEQHRIFEKFVRGSNARTSEVRGTGVGLALARRIVDAHDGAITVRSEPGRGSTFTVTFPVDRSPGAESGEGSRVAVHV